MRSSRVWMRPSWVVRASDCQVATVLGSNPASSDTVKSEGRQMKQCWIKYGTCLKIKSKKFKKAQESCLIFLDYFKNWPFESNPTDMIKKRREWNGKTVLDDTVPTCKDTDCITVRNVMKSDAPHLIRTQDLRLTVDALSKRCIHDKRSYLYFTSYCEEWFIQPDLELSVMFVHSHTCTVTPP